MSDLTKVPVSVITGFLGSGKTTLISQLMQNTSGKKLAVIVNEFGDVGVDGDILKSCAIPNCPAENIIELANGCICCTVADDFIPTIKALLSRDPRPDHILIETSGLALPKPLLKAFEWPEIRSRITIDGVIALADAEAVAAGRFAHSPAAVESQRQADNEIDHETPLSEVFEDQISCADIVLLTKVDLATPHEIAKAKKLILALAPHSIPIIEVSEGIADPRIILSLEVAAENDLDARPSHHDHADDHDHEDFDSIVIELPEIADPALLARRIEKLAHSHHILRVKGYVAVIAKPMRLLLQAVGARVRYQYDIPWPKHQPRITRLVVIAEHDHLNPDDIKKALLADVADCGS